MKGKFNALDFFEDDERRKPARRRKRPPQQFRADEWYDDIMDSLDNDYVEDEEVPISKSVGRTLEEDRAPRTRRSLPPEETYYTYEDVEDEEEDSETVVPETVKRSPTSEERPPRRRRPRPPKDDEYYEEVKFERRRRDAYSDRGRPAGRRRTGDQVSRQISTWFGPDDTDDDHEEEEEEEDDYSRGARRPRRRPKQQDESWSFTNILDGIFGVNREEVDMNAAMYNRQMGLDKSSRPQTRSERRRRPGQAVPYFEDREDNASSYGDTRDDLDMPDVVDVDAVIEDEEVTKPPLRKRERTIEERAAAFERVPPSGVPAWGPSGAVGVDARTKATLDALEEIREATRKVEIKEEQCVEAKEDIVILKA